MNIPTFTFGETASASQLMSALTTLKSSGQAIINSLTSFRNNALINFNRQVESLNSRTGIANRILGPKTLVNFVTTDFNDIDQVNTSATVKANSGAVTLREKSSPTAAIISSTNFSTSDGTAQQISSAYTIYTVTSNEVTPTGSFIIKLANPLSLNLMEFTLTAFASNPTITVSVSTDGVTYIPATSTSMSGYNLTAWFPQSTVSYVNLSITPSVPDDLNGNTYTFGLINIIAYQTNFDYISYFLTKPIKFFPQGSQVEFIVQNTTNLIYYILLEGSNVWSEVVNKTVLSLPSVVTEDTLTDPLYLSSGGISLTSGSPSYLNINPTMSASSIIYPNSLIITDTTLGEVVPVVFNWPTTDPNLGDTNHPYFSVIPVTTFGTTTYTFYYINNINPYNTHIFNLKYSYGSKTMTAVLKVQLSTSDNTQTPIFNGAVLQEA